MEKPLPQAPKSNRLNMWSRAGVSCSYVLYVYTALTVPVDIRSSTVSPSLLRLRQGLSPHIRHRCVLKSQQTFQEVSLTCKRGPSGNLNIGRVWRSTYKWNKTSDPSWNQGTEAYYLFSEIGFFKVFILNICLQPSVRVWVGLAFISSICPSFSHRVLEESWRRQWLTARHTS